MRTAQDKNYFHFTRKERNGILFLTTLAIISVLVSILSPYIFTSDTRSAQAYANDIAKLEAMAIDTASTRYRYTKKYEKYEPYSKRAYTDVKNELFYFDPNTISENDWKRLGLRDKTIDIIKNYLSKGGQFREANDIKKIWGLNESLASRLIPYAKIAVKSENYKNEFLKSTANKAFAVKSYAPVNINAGDTASLTKLPGIGPKLSQRIIKYRDRLGGFYKVEQVSETFGLPDSTFEKIRAWLTIEKQNIKTININTATLDELKLHPYIRYHLANAIVQYRLQHKSYSSVNEIRNIMLVDDTTFNKVSPYLVVE